jgi:predicted DNA-binding transcriptional regulator AlpA
MERITNETPLAYLTVGEFINIINRQIEIKIPTGDDIIPEIYGIDMVMKVTGYSKPTIFVKTSRNEIPHFKRDGRLFFNHKEILNWLTENKVK